MDERYGERSGLLHLIRGEGVPMRKKSITPKDARRAARLNVDGMSIAEVVNQTGYPYRSIRKIPRKSAFTVRMKGIKRLRLGEK
jgi:hypothetical protein